MTPRIVNGELPTVRRSPTWLKVNGPLVYHTPMYEVVDLGRALSVESTAEQAQHADAGRNLLKEANDAAATKGWPEASAKYQTAVQEFEKGLPAVGPREYAEAILRDATATYMSGDDKAARDLFALAVRLDPQQRLVADEAVAPQLQQARTELAGARRVSLDVDVRPAGARIFVDGELRGQHVEILPVRRGHRARPPQAGQSEHHAGRDADRDQPQPDHRRRVRRGGPRRCRKERRAAGAEVFARPSADRIGAIA